MELLHCRIPNYPGSESCLAKMGLLSCTKFEDSGGSSDMPLRFYLARF
jgi:hypothetical protein